MAVQTRSSSNCYTYIDGGSSYSDWVNATNAETDDTNYTYNTGAFLWFTEYFGADTFGFTIPRGSSIDGIVIRADVSEHSNGTKNLYADILPLLPWDPDSSVTISGTTKTEYSWGSASNNYGFGVSDVNGSDFGCVFGYYNSHVIRIYFIEIDVYYTPPISGNSFFWHPF